MLFCLFFICLWFSEHTLPQPTSTHGQFLVLSVPLQTPPYLSLYDHVNGLYWSFQGCGMSSGSLAHGWPHIQNDNNSVLQQKRFSYVNISCHSAHQWETRQEHRDNEGNSVVEGSVIWGSTPAIEVTDYNISWSQDRTWCIMGVLSGDAIKP